MTPDREMLEMAAKAAGKTNWQSTTNAYFGGCDSEGVPYWSPLTDYSDAMELSVLCGISIMHYPVFSMPKNAVIATQWQYIDISSGQKNNECIEMYGENAVLATCRAITRCAAEIGRAMR